MLKICLENSKHSIQSLDSLVLSRIEKADCLCYQAIAFLKLDNHEQALNSINQCIEIIPEHSLAIETMLKIYFL